MNECNASLRRPHGTLQTRALGASAIKLATEGPEVGASSSENLYERVFTRIYTQSAVTDLTTSNSMSTGTSRVFQAAQRYIYIYIYKATIDVPV